MVAIITMFVLAALAVTFVYFAEKAKTQHNHKK